jgi:light-regulated signal transduction histidine kinase (bacteriophytochrome)/CheY-like chemotaxis protein
MTEQTGLQATASVTVDLTNCDREPIHMLGMIQPDGFLIAVSSDWEITHVSANTPHWIGRAVDEILGLSLRAIISVEAVHIIGNCRMTLRAASATDRAYGVRLFADAQLFDIAVHLAGPMCVIECQPSEPVADRPPAALLGTMVGQIRRMTGFLDLCREAARQVKAFTGFEHVMIYKFHADGSGEVIAEALRSGMTSFMGLRYPASDIPSQARALYERNWLRVITDVGADPVAIVSAPGGSTPPLDLSLSVLRAVSPIHIEYLRNMDVGASMSVSILLNGKLWGLIACHHTTRWSLNFEGRNTVELFGQVFSLLVESRERDLDLNYETRARDIHTQLMSAVAAQSSTLDDVDGLIAVMVRLIPCDGVGVWLGERATLEGATPTREEFLRLVRFLNLTAAGRIFSTQEISQFPEFSADATGRVAGILSIPISRTPRDFIVFFRQELARSVVWAGDPNKPVGGWSDGGRLMPRKSFEAWHEIVRGRAPPWTEPELRIAESLRVTLIEIILRLSDLAEEERLKAASQQKLLIAELNHRVRNILGLIQGLVSRGKANAETVELYAGVLDGRVRALARAHDQITDRNWGPGALGALIANEAAAYLNDKSDRVRRSGPDVLLEPQGFCTLALVVHELMTNSAKYGALLSATGHVDVSWSIDGAHDLIVDWREFSGPSVTTPTRRGFGTTLIERSIPHDLGGKTVLHYHPAGVEARMTVPARFVTLGTAALAPIDKVAPEPTGRLWGNVLLVEDHIVIAEYAAEMLRELGAARVDIASHVEDALASIAISRPVFAVLDVNLAGTPTFAVASALRGIGVPFCFATGYGRDLVLPAEFTGTPIVTKPYSVQTLAIAIGALGLTQPNEQ